MRMALCVACLIGALCVAAVADGPGPAPDEPPEVDHKRIEALVGQLGHRDFKKRMQASKALLKIGAPAIPALRKAMLAKDLEIRTRAKRLLGQIPDTEATSGFWDTHVTNVRKAMLAWHGGSAATELAVIRALNWLHSHQSASGRWDGDGFQAHCKKNTCSGVAKLGWVDPGLTGLATLAFLGAGHTHRTGRFKATVKKAIRYLMKIQAADGLIGGKRGHYMYNHAICAMALAEAYGRTRSPLLKDAAQRAITWLLKAQNPGKGWRYRERDGDSDISVTGWCVMALKAARAAQLEVTGLAQSFKSAETFIESITDDSHYITGYRKRPPRGWRGPTSSRFVAPDLGVNTAHSHAANHTPTAAATMCRALFGRTNKQPKLRGGATMLASMLPVWNAGGGRKLNQIDYYYWYYGTIAMFHHGGERWKTWNAALRKALVANQRTAGDETGSWAPTGAWGFAGGRVYATAINALTLEIYYRHQRAGTLTKGPQGLLYHDLVQGRGARPKKGDTLRVHYTGTLLDGKTFDSSRKLGRGPFSFTLGAGRVIKGWELGLATMRVGGRRRLIIPPALAYGKRPPRGALVGPNATLLFEVELLGIVKPK